MFARPSVLALAVLAASPGSHGCGGGPDNLPPLDSHGQRVSFGTDLVDDVCQGTLAMLDRGVEQIEAALELPANGEKIAVYVSEEALADQCTSNFAAGCARRSQVVLGSSFQYYYLHELVHARLLQFMGRKNRLFEEGIASAIGSGSGSCLGSEECASADLAQFMATTSTESFALGGYAAGADLIHGMLAQYGPGDVLAFLAELNRDTPVDETRVKYQTRFGADLDEDFASFRRDPLDEFTPMQLGCIAPEPPRTGADGGVILQASMDCASPQVINDFYSAANGYGSNEGSIEWTFEVTPEQAGVFVLKGAVEETGTLSVLRCSVNDFRWWHLADQGPSISGSYIPPKGGRAGEVLVLGPGLYQLEWKHALDPNARLDVVFAPPCTFENQDCPEGQQCTIWNECAEQVEQPATLGDPCTETADGPHACEAGTRCLGGVCTAECDATRPCPAGEACARQRVCGPICELLGDDCAPGLSCLPTTDAELTALARGQCVAAGAGALLDACRRRESDCGEGLSCEWVGQGKCDSGDLDGCCAPLCDPAAADPGCPEGLSHCDPLENRPVGVCRPDTGQSLPRPPP